MDEGEGAGRAKIALAEAAPVGLIVTRGEKLFTPTGWRSTGWATPTPTPSPMPADSGFRLPRLGRRRRARRKKTLLARAAGGETFSVDLHRASLDWDRRGSRTLHPRPAGGGGAGAARRPAGGEPAPARRRRRGMASHAYAAADGVVLLNADGAILGLDRKAEALLDYDRDKVAGENFTLLFARESQVSALDYFTRAKAGAERRGREALGRTRRERRSRSPFHRSPRQGGGGQILPDPARPQGLEADRARDGGGP